MDVRRCVQPCPRTEELCPITEELCPRTGELCPRTEELCPRKEKLCLLTDELCPRIGTGILCTCRKKRTRGELLLQVHWCEICVASSVSEMLIAKALLSSFHRGVANVHLIEEPGGRSNTHSNRYSEWRVYSNVYSNGGACRDLVTYAPCESLVVWVAVGL